jgi:hypothetical protein
MRRRSRWARGLGLGALVAATAVAAEPLAVRLELEGPAQERQALSASIQELLARLGVSLQPRGEVLAVIAVSLGPATCRIAIQDASGAQVVSRTLARGASTVVTLEAVATVVHSAVEELAEQARRPLARRVIPSPVPIAAEVSEAPAPAPLAVELGAFVSGRAFGATAPLVLGGGLQAALRLNPGDRWTPRLALQAGWSGPFEGETSLLQLSAQTVSVRLTGGARLALVPGVWLEGGLGAGLDAFLLAGRSSALPAGSFDRQRLEASPVLTAQLGVRLGLPGGVGALLTLGADVDLWPRRYVADLQGTREVLFEAFRVRPSALLGFTFDVAGAR